MESKMDYISLGSTPFDEECVQVDSSNYTNMSALESRAYITQLQRQFSGEIPDGCYFRAKRFPHDFGSYREVCMFFDSVCGFGGNSIKLESNNGAPLAQGCLAFPSSRVV